MNDCAAVDAGFEDGDEDIQRPMRHNDLQLQELLRLARSCLKYDRVPGELSEQGFFDKFEAEHEASRPSEEDNIVKQQDEAPAPSAASPEEEVVNSTLKSLYSLKRVVTNPSFMAILEGATKEVTDACGLMPPSSDDTPPDGRALRNQTSQLERIAAEAQKALEACTADLNYEILKRLRMEKEEDAAQEDFQKVQHQLRLAKGMVKRQNGEIKKLHSDVQELKFPAPVSVQSAPASIPAPQPPATGSGRSKAGRPRPGGRPVGQMVNVGATAMWVPADMGATAPAAAGAKTVTDGRGVAEQSACTVGPVEEVVKQAKQPRPPDLATSFVLPPKSRTFSSVLASRPKDGDTWKLYIP